MYLNNSVLFLLPYPLLRAPSQRFRVEAFFPLLEQQNIPYRTHCFLNEKTWLLLYHQGSVIQKAWAILGGFFDRLFVVLFVAYRFRYVFVHREAAPLGPPIFEWILSKVLRKEIIYDFDDAIWIPTISAQNKIASLFKCFWKTKYVCRWAKTVAAGNAHLAGFAQKYNGQVVQLPTCVDTVSRFNQLQLQDAALPVIGWTGSHSTLQYLELLLPVFQQLEEHYDFELLVICSHQPSFQLRRLRFIQWNEATEIRDLLQINIGVMPLVSDSWSEGKCGFKIIQYLSLGIPAVASPVGVNKQIVEHGVNGFLCPQQQDWFVALETLLQDASLRRKMGASGHQKVRASYSIQAHETSFLSLFGTPPESRDVKQLLHPLVFSNLDHKSTQDKP